MNSIVSELGSRSLLGRGSQPPWVFVVIRWLKVPTESQNFAYPPSEIRVPQDLTWIPDNHTGKGQLNTEKFIFISQFSFFQAKNLVKISKNTPYKKWWPLTRSAKVPPWSRNFLNPPFKTKVQNFQPSPFRRGVQALIRYSMKVCQGITWIILWVGIGLITRIFVTNGIAWKHLIYLLSEDYLESS